MPEHTAGVLKAPPFNRLFGDGNLKRNGHPVIVEKIPGDLVCGSCQGLGTVQSNQAPCKSTDDAGPRSSEPSQLLELFYRVVEMAQAEEFQRACGHLLDPRIFVPALFDDGDLLVR
jgi:hypothetical protein